MFFCAKFFGNSSLLFHTRNFCLKGKDLSLQLGNVCGVGFNASGKLTQGLFTGLLILCALLLLSLTPVVLRGFSSSLFLEPCNEVTQQLHDGPKSTCVIEAGLVRRHIVIL